MKTSYEERLQISIDGDDDTRFETREGTLIAIGYERIVIGERGPYIEFGACQIRTDSIKIPKDAEWRRRNKKSFYIEFRSVCRSYVKAYLQKKPVDYADYRRGMYYVSPFDLLANGKPIIEPLSKKPKAGRLV